MHPLTFIATLSLLTLGATAQAGETIKTTAAPAASPAPSGLEKWWNGPSLTDNWFGQGDTMNKHGVYLITDLNQFGQGLVSGTGNQNFKYGGKLDIFLHLEGQQMGTWKGLSLDAHPNYLYGNNALFSGGTISPVNTALLLPVAGQDIFTLSSLFLTQKFNDVTVSVGRFNTIDFTALYPYDGGNGTAGFWNTSFVAPLVEAKDVPPVTNGALVKIDTQHNVLLTFAAFDAQNLATTTGLGTPFNNGVSLLGDVSVVTKFFDLEGKQSINGTFNTAQTNALGQLPQLTLPQFFGPPATKDNTWALNYHFEQAIYHPKDQPTANTGLFGSIGVSDGNPNPVKWAATFGLGGKSPIPGRTDDRIGIGYYYLGLSDAIKNQPLLATRLRDEQGVEIFYNAAVNKWWSITADVQVIDPAVTRNTTDVVFGMGTKIHF